MIPFTAAFATTYLSSGALNPTQPTLTDNRTLLYAECQSGAWRQYYCASRETVGSEKERHFILSYPSLPQPFFARIFFPKLLFVMMRYGLVFVFI